MRTFCLGYSHDKCDSCRHGENWKMLNQMPDALRLSLQRKMRRINIDKCRLTHMGEYVHKDQVDD